MMKYTKEQLDTINSLRKVNDNMYSLHYQNNYGINEIIAGNSKNFLEVYLNIQKYFKTSKPLINPFVSNGGCIGITAFNEKDEALFCRNFDYRDTNCMVVWVDSKEGYKSLCMADFNFMAYDRKICNIEKSNKARLLAAPLVCMDGINEKGLAMSIIEVKFDPTKQRSGRKRLFPTLLLRLALDTCSTVDEVERLFSNYDMQGTLGNDYHYHVTDSRGNAAIYEFINNKLVVIKNNEKEYFPNRYMYVPSFFVHKDGNNKYVTPYAIKRNETAKEDITNKNGLYSETELLKLLEKCKTNHPHEWMPHMVKTVWSIVYNTNNLSALVCANSNFNDVYRLNLHSPQNMEKLVNY